MMHLPLKALYDTHAVKFPYPRLIVILFLLRALTGYPAVVCAAQPQYVDAMLRGKGNKIYAFTGSFYYRYDTSTNRMDPGYPKAIQGNWPGLTFKKIDAAVNFQNGKAFFFSGGQYLRYDIINDRADPGYPKPINPAWRLPWTSVDAAIYWTSGVVYFFNNASGTFVRYRVGATQPEPGYPKAIAGNWKGLPHPKIGGAVSYGGRGYFTWSNGFRRLVIPSGAAEPGYPKELGLLPDNPLVRTPPASRTVTRPPTPAQTGTVKGTCKINGVLTYIQRTAKGGGVYKQWNNVKVELHQANSYFNQRYNQYIAKRYTPANAMSACLREDALWKRVTASITKPTTLRHKTYGMSFSWFGFVGLKPGVYRVVVPGYPALHRWLRFAANGQKLDVTLVHQ